MLIFLKQWTCLVLLIRCCWHSWETIRTSEAPSQPWEIVCWQHCDVHGRFLRISAVSNISLAIYIWQYISFYWNLKLTAIDICEAGTCGTWTFSDLLTRAGLWLVPLVSYPSLQQLWSRCRSAHALTTTSRFLSHLCWSVLWFSSNSRSLCCCMREDWSATWLIHSWSWSWRVGTFFVTSIIFLWLENYCPIKKKKIWEYCPSYSCDFG